MDGKYKEKGPIMICQTLHRKWKVEDQEPHWTLRVKKSLKIRKVNRSRQSKKDRQHNGQKKKRHKKRGKRMASWAARIAFVNATYLLFFYGMYKMVVYHSRSMAYYTNHYGQRSGFQQNNPFVVPICILGTCCTALWVEPREPSPVIRNVKWHRMLSIIN